MPSKTHRFHKLEENCTCGKRLVGPNHTPSGLCFLWLTFQEQGHSRPALKLQIVMLHFRKDIHTTLKHSLHHLKDLKLKLHKVKTVSTKKMSSTFLQNIQFWNILNVNKVQVFRCKDVFYVKGPLCCFLCSFWKEQPKKSMKTICSATFVNMILSEFCF